MDATSAADTAPLPGLRRRAIRLEQFSLAWMLIEASAAVTAGVIAGSLALTSSGFDSVIELASAFLVLRRLQAELAEGRTSEQAERRVLRIIAVTFFALAAYVVIGSIIDLATQAHPERSPIGIGLTASSLLVMPLLGWRKRRVGASLRHQLVLADAAETILCATLARGLARRAARRRLTPRQPGTAPAPGRQRPARSRAHSRGPGAGRG